MRVDNSNNKFSSEYWGGLVNALKNKKISISWVHSYLRISNSISIFDTAFIIRKLNTESKNLSKHFLLEEFVNLKYYKNVFKDLF